MAKNINVSDIRRVMDEPHHIRNVSIIGHVDHGKSTIVDSILGGRVEKGNTTKSTGMPLYYPWKEEEYLVNLVDTPGELEFSPEVTAALRISDGALLVVDCISGVSVQTDTVLHQALAEQIRPVLTINKMDRCLLELQVDGEEAYQSFRSVTEAANLIIYAYENMRDFTVCPEKGTVAFSAGLHGWAFTLSDIAKMYASKFNVDESKMMEKLWGENYFDSAIGKWTTKSSGSPTCKRGFVQLCYEPIKKIIRACISDAKDELWPLLQKLNVQMTLQEKEQLMGKALMKSVMEKWLPASKAIPEMMIQKLPSPATAQNYRVKNLYEGPLDDHYAAGIRECDPKGPLMMYVSKMVPIPAEKGRFFAFGRVFSGSVQTGMKVRVLGRNYVAGDQKKKDLYEKNIQRCAIWMGGKQLVPVHDVPCGNTVAIFGIDSCINKAATITEVNRDDPHPIRRMRFSVTPVVRVAVSCTVPTDLPKLMEGLRRLVKSDPIADWSIEETGEHIVAGTGELHLETCLSDLEKNLMSGVKIIKQEPVVSFRETVLEESSTAVMTKTPNKLNRFYMKARPLGEGIVESIEGGEIIGWDNKASKFWCFGPAKTGPNLLVDTCKGLQYLNEIKESVVAGFQGASEGGALAEENMRGICFNLCDASLHCDAIHRRGAEVMPTVQNAVLASQLTSKPRLMEPVYLVDIQAPDQALGGIYKVVSQNRGQVIEHLPLGPGLIKIIAYLPVTESFGFSNKLQKATAGQARYQCVFDHWDMMQSDPLEEGSQAAKMVHTIRKRKGLKEEILLTDYVGKQQL